MTDYVKKLLPLLIGYFVLSISLYFLYAYNGKDAWGFLGAVFLFASPIVLLVGLAFLFLHKNKNVGIAIITMSGIVLVVGMLIAGFYFKVV